MRHSGSGGLVPAPSVFAYLDYRQYLTDWIRHRKQADRSYSYAAFGRAGACSKAALANVLSGARTPRAETLDAFARAMDLSPSERNYLGLLVEFSSARDMAARQEILGRILSAERFHQVRLAENEDDALVLRYFEHWYVPAIRELASLPGFRPDPEWVADVLRPRIGIDEARDGLETLFALGFLRMLADGGIEAREVRFRTRPEAAQEAAHHVHTQVVPALLRQLDSTRSQEQHVLTATLVLSADKLPEAKARLNAVVDQLATMADDRTPDGPHRVYQLAVQLIPLSDEIA